jgi:hypothetical protein
MYDQMFRCRNCRNYGGFRCVMCAVMSLRGGNRVDRKARQAARRRLVEALVGGGSVRMIG